MTDTTVSTSELKQWAEKRADDAGRLARELLPYRLASRTQEPAEWQVEAAAACIKGGSAFDQDDRMEMARAALRAASITPPAPERSKEEVIEALFQAVAPFIAGTAWREVRAALSAALSKPGEQ